MSPRFVLGRENVLCVEVVNRSLKADCTDFTVDNRTIKVIRADTMVAAPR